MTLDTSPSGQPLLPVADEPVPASAERFGRRWRLVAAGLSNVWRYGDLLMDANSGRLLMRGPNGTGKTTALEALWPFLLDLNQRQLGAGQARQTTLSSLMREGSNGSRRRVGYAWLTFAGPGEEGELSYGVRLQFSEGSSPPVKVVPFRVAVRPVTGLPLVGDGRTALSLDEFTAAVDVAAGHMFADEEEYVADLAGRMLRTTSAEAKLLAGRIRQLRNPNLLGDLGPVKARDALRDALPGVDDEVIRATAEALAESEETRKAFDRDRDNAKVINEFAAGWAGHTADILRGAHRTADELRGELRRRQGEVRRLDGEAAAFEAEHSEAERNVSDLGELRTQLEGRVEGLKASDAYKSAESLTALERQLAAELAGAESAWAALASAARETLTAAVQLDGQLTDIKGDVEAEQAKVRAVDPVTDGLGDLVTWTFTPRLVMTVGDRSLDPGAVVTPMSDTGLLADAVTAWRARSSLYTGRADAAALAVTDHEPVTAAETQARTADGKVTALNDRLDRDERRLRELTDKTAAAAAALLDQVSAWTSQHPALSAPTDADDGWSVEDVKALRSEEAATVLVAVDEFSSFASRLAGARAGQLRAEATTADTRARELLGQAAELHREAAELRAGKLLALPRPTWSGTGVDNEALGAAIKWQPSIADAAKPALEAALAAAGLLGATLTPSGATTAAWRVEASGPITQPNLTEVLAVDAAHPLAALAAVVLQRVALADTADAANNIAAGVLVIGKDGWFRAGVTVGQPALASGFTAWPPAQHVGARQRRQAALARAEQLDVEAAACETEAGELETAAKHSRREATALQDASAAFPSRSQLQTAEAARAGKATEVAEVQGELDEATGEAARRHRLHEQLSTEWAERTRACNLPADLAELSRIEADARHAAQTLRSAAGMLADRLALRLARILAAHSAGSGQQLAELLGKAQTARGTAIETQSKMDALRESAGATIDEVLQNLQDTQRVLKGTIEQLGPATTNRNELATKVAVAEQQVADGRDRVGEAKPQLDAAMRELVALLDVPGVVDALFDSTRPRAEHLLADVAASLASAKSYTSRSVRDRYDEARAKLAGSWVLANGDPHGELLTYQFSYKDDSFTPARAAAHATALAARAEASLAEVEEKALGEFVVGMLPSAIRTGYVKVRDWTKNVNTKMRSAAASSQLNVQVRVNIANDLPEHVRTVYDLACHVFDGDRTPDQERALGSALQALINAADGEDMAARVAAAVNIREWMDVHYEIHRADGTVTNWTARTGLSGGERRLVVLAPMLASIAAGYDRFGESTLRLAALDEVPAEVDEQGREGLARYLAQLDLDLVCTSYLWDGAPGAWDGVDAWDLEAGPDTTVVAFPMLVRGVVELPGDTVPQHGGSS